MKKILVVRNDKIGDFMLAWPAMAALAESGAFEVSVLVPEYTAELARECRWVTNVLIDPGPKALFAQQQALANQIMAHRFDAAIALFSNWRNAVILRHVGIPYRLAPATKLAQILYTHRLVQRRSRSEKPEWAYNLDLAVHCLKHFGCTIPDVRPPYLVVDSARRQAARHQVAQDLGLDIQAQWLMVHPGSGGSAVNLSSRQYEVLVAQLRGLLPGWEVVLTAGPAEFNAVQALQQRLNEEGVRVALLAPEQGLRGLVAALSNAGAFMAGSTGPLHIAGALDVPTVGFFPARRSATSLRWQPLNSPGRHLPFQASEDKGENTFDDLDLPGVANHIANWLGQLYQT